MTVTPVEIAVELGRATPDASSTEFAQWELWIADALMLIQVRLGDVSLLDQDRLDYVVRQAVAAHARRPDDATQVAVSVGDGSLSRTYRSSRGRVEILDEWWALLAPTERTTSRAFSIRPSGSGYGSGHIPWCNLFMGGMFCSCGANLTRHEYPLFEGGLLSGGDPESDY